MYLTKIDEETGFVFHDKLEDGILAIKEFRELINDKKYGISCFTAVALTADYKSPIHFYDETDRPRKAQEEVTGDRDYWEWNSEPIQKALKKYEELQYDPTIEEKRIYYNQKIKKMKEMENFPNLTEEQQKKTSLAAMRKDLRLINEDIVLVEKRTENKDIFQGSPIVNGYTLSRLEQKLTSKNSFYNQIR